MPMKVTSYPAHVLSHSDEPYHHKNSPARKCLLAGVIGLLWLGSWLGLAGMLLQESLPWPNQPGLNHVQEEGPVPPWKC